MMCCYIIKDGIDKCLVAFLRHSFTKCDEYEGVLIQVVDIIACDDADATKRARFYCFHG